jgi:nucleoside phosphorylase
MSLAFLETDGRADRSAPSRFRPDQPQCREDFEIAIICALPLEFDAVSLLFDEYYDTHGDQFGRAVGDKNHYVTGRIGAHDVVLTLLASMGKIQAATTGAHIGASFPNLKLVLLVGICGGVPVLKGGTELLLGDVVVSEAVVQYDFGRQYPDAFLLKGTTQGNLNRSSADIDGLLVTLHTQLGLERLQQRTTCFLNNLQTSASTKSDTDRYLNPGAAEDVLFAPENRHRHLNCTGSCICGQWGKPSDPVCETARDSSCAQLGCADAVPRKRIQLRLALERGRPDTKLQEPLIFLGRIASGDTIMKSGLTRDKLAKELDIIAFEMEGSGIWCEHPCIVVKGVCDYADSHKSKRWQNFAAATAASATKALLERWPRTDKRSTSRLLRSKSRPFLGSFAVHFVPVLMPFEK